MDTGDCVATDPPVSPLHFSSDDQYSQTSDSDKLPDKKLRIERSFCPVQKSGTAA